MSLRRKIAAALDERLGEAPPHAVSAEEGPHRLSLQLLANAPVGVSFDALDFAVTGRPEWPVDALRAWGERLTSRVTYLMEPLVVLEVDPSGGEVSLRSKNPTPRDGLRAYYEVRLSRSGTLRLARVVFDEEARRRRPAPCQMSREVLERLADDLVASVA
jgi:hypothetical protein